MSTKPKVFIASSQEAERIALAVQQNLETHAEVTLWTQDAFRLGQNIIDELIHNLQRSQFGIFVFSPDDKITIRGKEQKTVRDNVILELGLFIGRLGKDRSFVIKPQHTDMRLPTDLLGVVIGQYDAERTDNQRAALAPVCVQIADIIQHQLQKQSKVLNPLVETSLETVCRAIGLPLTPEQASLRAFIFQKQGDELVCSHFWDPNPSEEEVGRTRFTIDKETASKVIVVRCFRDNATIRTESDTTEGANVQPLQEGFKGMQGKINPNLRYVLAAPIRNEDGSLWGVVDFDASNEDGKKLLQTEVSNTVMMLLGKVLSSTLS